MKAIAWTKYGAPEVLKVKDFEKPSPKSNEVLIKIHASTVTAGDCRLRAFNVPMGFWLPTRLVFGLIKPRVDIIGMEISGEVVSTGEEVTLFEKGDKVYGTSGMRLRANAQYISLPEKSSLVKAPTNTSNEQAVATIFGGLTAIHFLRDKANIQAGQKILINGASGAVGTASIQLAKYFGAEVTGVCSTSNIDLLKSLGAKKVIDYTKEKMIENNETYDVILDAVGNLSLSQCKTLLAKDGKVILINAGLLTNLLSMTRKQVICGVAGESKESLTFLRERIEAGDIVAVIDKVYPLTQTAEAHSYVDKGHKKGNVVIFVKHEKN
ncbi:MAG: NAD(P)-dependent alcohol dehydrogenase [uncultured Thiotrichaceae bacterium]|uniref:NAD(P)-dependent alcohol dehydrogenase n=1 Tax=uncultured Thiotrichaceae bacterium TaxID=298394 RepID=A0A6S6T7V6_9GAMM|nr:MAG: NAD(P)-dependent alcohol dehydrogenase [uncultured Thiotrichaceae bacterium]